MNLLTPSVNHLLDLWLDEDLGRGDLTAAATHNDFCSANWTAKHKGVFCGGEVVKHLFKRLDQSVHIDLLLKDGELFAANQKILKLHGPASSLLAGERSALNIAMHLSGIATTTAKLVAELKGTGVQLADTRKTTPGLRIFEKYAIRCGGGINHRLGLDDAAMIKENHIECAGNISSAVRAVRTKAPWTSKIIVEAETPQQAIEAVIAGADGVLLDEIPPEVLHRLVPQLRTISSTKKHNGESKPIVLEASGINPMNLKAYAATGIDLISTSAPISRSHWIDLSMRIETSHQKDSE